MAEFDENMEEEQEQEEVKQPFYKNIFFYVGLIVFVFIFTCMGTVIIHSSSKAMQSNQYKNKIVERPKTSANISKMKILPYMPTIKAGEKFKFEITRELNMTGTLKDVSILVKLPSSIPGRQRIENVEISPAPNQIVDKDDGRYAEIFMPQNNMTLTIKGTGVVKTYNLANAQKGDKNIDGALTEEEKENYLSEEDGIELSSRYINKLASERIPTATNDLDTAKNVFDFVVNHMRYDVADLNANKGAVNALHSHTGVSQEFADSFVALCRAKKVPARIVKGFEIPFKDNKNKEISKYVWAEVYSPKYGWVTFDPTNEISDTLRMEAKKAKVTAFDLLSVLYKNKSYVIYEPSVETVNYQGDGNIKSKNMSIKFSK